LFLIQQSLFAAALLFGKRKFFARFQTQCEDSTWRDKERDLMWCCFGCFNSHKDEGEEGEEERLLSQADSDSESSSRILQRTAHSMVDITKLSNADRVPLYAHLKRKNDFKFQIEQVEQDLKASLDVEFSTDLDPIAVSPIDLSTVVIDNV
jgi:hypothetical protein